MDQVQQLRGTFIALPRRAQLAILGVAVVTLLVLFLVFRAATHTSYMAVSTGIKPEQTGQVTKALDAAKVSYKMADQGTTVMVPSAQMSQARVALAQANVLSGSGSHTSCATIYGSQSSMLSGTSAQQAVNAKQCAQNQLANDIESIQGVQHANVTVNTPDKELFASEAGHPTAAITIDTGGNSLDPMQVRAIQHLAASSVDGLTAERVTIVDETGTLLTGGESSGGSSMSATRKLQTEAQYNKALTQQLQGVYDEIAGKGNTKVVVRAALDLDQVQRETKTFGGPNHAAGITGASDVDLEKLSGPQATAGGAAGTASNVTPSYQGTNGTSVSSGSNYLHSKEQTTKLVDVLGEKTLVAPGAVTKLNVAVFADKRLSTGMRQDLKDATTTIMGGNAADSFAFLDRSKIGTAVHADSGAIAARRKAVGKAIEWGVVGLGLILFAFFIRRALAARTQELLETPRDLLLLGRGDFEPVPLAELEAAIANSTDVENQRRLELQRKVEQIAISKPADVATQVRGWLHDNDPYRRTA